MHLDGMGSTVAAGGLRAGRKVVVALEASDALAAYRLARFITFAKPGGSRLVTNPPVLPAHRGAWAEHGLRAAEFELAAGDAYVIPAGVPHQFENLEPALSVAWNLLPLEARACTAARACLGFSLAELQRKLGKRPNVAEGATEHAPVELLVERECIAAAPTAAG